MDYQETNQGSKVKVLLSADELQLPAIDALVKNFQEWLRLSKECAGGRKTRSANRKADILYDEIMQTKIPAIKLNYISSPPIDTRSESTKNTLSVESSLDSDSDCSSTRPMTRSLRSRSRTPTVQTNKSAARQLISPSTPAHQRIRPNLKQPPSGGSSNSGSSCVLSAALNQQHPSVSVTKIRQLLRADSAQKKREEEKERQERLRMERKLKDEKAEAQKRQLLEERAIKAKSKREERLLHAAEVRKAREEAKHLQKVKDYKHNEKPPVEEKKASQKTIKHHIQAPTQQQHQMTHQSQQQSQPQLQPKPESQPKTEKLNETFKKPADDVDNIDISIQDETTDEPKEKVPVTAAWARAPYLREALVKQFSKSGEEIQTEVLSIFTPVNLPVELEQIFGSNKAAGTRNLLRSSSAVWSPASRPLKRTSSMVLTPNKNGKR